MYHKRNLTKKWGRLPPRWTLNYKERRQRARLFHRLVSGMYYHRKDEFRFLTVTSAPDSPDLYKSWHNFLQQIRNNYGKFEYFAVWTSEGHGVMHIIFVGSYIPFDWIQERWKHIHGAFHVNIKKVRPYSSKLHLQDSWWSYKAEIDDKVYFPPGLASYVLNQYLANQNAITRISNSRGWVYKGFVEDWNQIKRFNKKDGKKKIVEEWHKFLKEKRIPQARFKDKIFGLKEEE